MRESPTKYDLFQFKFFLIPFLIFFFIWILFALPYKLQLNDPVSNALTDFDTYDIVFSKMRPPVVPDTSIVIVNAGFLSRRQIAKQLERIEKENPKAIGIDLLFSETENQKDDSLLTSVITRYDNCVLVNQMSAFNESSESFDSLALPAIHFKNRIKYGFANLPTSGDESRRTVRDFIPFALARGDTVQSFASQIAGLYDPAAIKEIIERGKKQEPINFRRNISELGYYFINYDQVLDTAVNLSVCKDKIVLLGFTGIDLQTKTFEDIFFTPLNQNYAGKSFPDMYGVVIHANIISMILANDYINEMPFAATLLIAFFICYIVALSLERMKMSYAKLYKGLSKVVILTVMVFYFFVAVYIFYLYNFKMNLTFTLFAILLVPTSLDIYDDHLSTMFNMINPFKKNGVQI
ncbi:MAG: CHASE2 domain-containing protein [Melioribacteraceae bacterium]